MHAQSGSSLRRLLAVLVLTVVAGCGGESPTTGPDPEAMRKELEKQNQFRQKERYGTKRTPEQ